MHVKNVSNQIKLLNYKRAPLREEKIPVDLWSYFFLKWDRDITLVISLATFVHPTPHPQHAPFRQVLQLDTRSIMLLQRINNGLVKDKDRRTNQMMPLYCCRVQVKALQR